MKDLVKLYEQVQESLFILQLCLWRPEFKSEKAFMIAFIGKTIRLAGIYLQKISDIEVEN